MKNFVLKILLSIICCFFFYSSPIKAAPVLTDLPDSTYITWQGIDWTWASCVSNSPYAGNTVYGPALHEGWRSATSSEWGDFLNLSGPDRIGLFTRTDMSYIHSAAYWNSDDFFKRTVDNGDMMAGSIKTSLSTWNSMWDLVYVRTPTAVPIPSTFSLLGLGLLGLVRINRKKQYLI